MEHTVPALIVAAAILIGGLVMTGVTTGALERVDRSWRDMLTVAEERMGTALEQVSTDLSPDGSQVTVVMKNAGRVAVADPRLMDVIISYRDTGGQQHNLWLPYADGPLQDNTWQVASISNDRRNPSILDPGETMELVVRVSPPIDTANSDRWLVVALASGVTYTVYF
jgi:archaellum component FlaF (FlaF/FlaG flagellin family)